MTDLPPARTLVRDAPPTPCHDLVVLCYDDRFLRRKRLETVHGEGFLVDLPETTHLDPYFGFELEDGRVIQIVAAEEELLAISGDNLARIAWHIGNRHAPCQIEAARLLIRKDHVMEEMLTHLDATVAHVSEPFTPEGGAYGQGRTMGHEHSPRPAHPGHVHHHGSHENPFADDSEDLAGDPDPIR